MGAALDYRTVKANDAAEAIEKFQQLQESDRWENGHSYSGSIGMLSGRPQLQTGTWNRKDAVDHLADFHQKWDPANVYELTGEDSDDRLWLIGGWCSS